jgi:hypothetical protein
MLRILGALASVALLAGCTSGQAGVANMTNNFSYGGQTAGKSGTETFTWENTMGKAMVSWGGQASKGSFTLTIQDAAGKQVYSGSQGAGQGGMAGNTASGKAGSWVILLRFDDFTGQMGLSLVASGSTYNPGYP